MNIFTTAAERGIPPEQLAGIISQRVVLGAKAESALMDFMLVGPTRASAQPSVDFENGDFTVLTSAVKIDPSARLGLDKDREGGLDLGGAARGGGGGGGRSGGGAAVKQQVQAKPGQKAVQGSVARAASQANNPNAVAQAPAAPPKATNPGAKPGGMS